MGGSGSRSLGCGEVRGGVGVSSGGADRASGSAIRAAGAWRSADPRRLGTVEVFMCRVEAGWDAEATRRPHGQHTTVVVHLDIEKQAAALHLGPLLSDADRRYLTCDATGEVWFERDGRGHRCRAGDPAGQPAAAPRARAPRPYVRGARLWCHPRSARPSPAALGRRRPYRVGQPGAVMSLPSPVCTIGAGSPSPDPPSALTVRDHAGRALSPGSLARPPTTPPPAVAPCPGPTGERAQWWWYTPFQPQPPPTTISAVTVAGHYRWQVKIVSKRWPPYFRCRAKNRAASSPANCGTPVCPPMLAYRVFSWEPKASNRSSARCRSFPSSSHCSRTCSGIVT